LSCCVFLGPRFREDERIEAHENVAPSRGGIDLSSRRRRPLAFHSTKSRAFIAAYFAHPFEQGEMTMVRIIFACAISILMAATLAAPAEAQQPQSERQAIVVAGEGTIGAAPDYAEITAGVTTRAKTAKDASDANAKLMTAVTAALLDAGIAQKDIQTTRFSIQPVYTSGGSNTEQKLTGFSSSNQVTVTIRQTDKVSEIADRLVAAGATNIGNLVFLHSNVSKLLDQAREAAVADARRKAELYAKASGVTLGRVLWISENSAYTPIAAMDGMFRAKAVATPIASGEDMLRVEITVGFDIAH
jgi:uncharacterized protein